MTFALRPPMQKYASLGHLGLIPIRLSSLAKPRWALGGHEHGTLPYVAEHNKCLGCCVLHALNVTTRVQVSMYNETIAITERGLTPDGQQHLCHELAQ